MSILSPRTWVTICIVIGSVLAGLATGFATGIMAIGLMFAPIAIPVAAVGFTFLLKDLDRSRYRHLRTPEETGEWFCACLRTQQWVRAADVTPEYRLSLARRKAAGRAWDLYRIIEQLPAGISVAGTVPIRDGLVYIRIAFRYVCVEEKYTTALDLAHAAQHALPIPVGLIANLLVPKQTEWVLLDKLCVRRGREWRLHNPLPENSIDVGLVEILTRNP